MFLLHQAWFIIILKIQSEQFWMRNQEIDQFPLFSPKRISRNIINPNTTTLNTCLSSFAKEQTHAFATLSQKCSSMEYALGAVEVLLVQMAEKVQKYNEVREAEVLGSLKIKQSEFIIGELRTTIAKQIKKEEKIMQEIEAEKRRSQRYKEEANKAEGKSSALAEKVAQLQTTIRKKTQEIQTLTSNINKMREEDNKNRSKSMTSRESLSLIRSNQEYAELQDKLEELQREFTSEIQKLLAKNNDLCLQLKKRQDANTQLTSINRQLRKQAQSASTLRYQLQIKSKQESLQLLQLQESYNKLVQKSNSNEIMLHKQLQEYKVKEAEIKNQYKKEKKNFKAYLSMLAEYINGSKYYFTALQVKDQLQEIKRLYEKNLKKKLETLSRELEYSQAEYKKFKVKYEELEQKMVQMEKQKGASFKELQSEERVDRNSENGSLLNNRSSDRSEEEKYRGVEEKYKHKLQALRKEIKSKQTKINELQRQQQTDFQKNKQKILELQLLISQKTNQIRKLDLKFKQRDYEFIEYQNRIKQLQGKLKFLAEKQQSQKQSNSKLMEIKTQNYEEKLKLIKNNYRQLQKKEQEKTIKYNKLKSKYEKYELQASESIKRKNAQIDQLLKENNKCKAENKLLQEKININNIIQGEISKNKETPNGVNQDLIEQIEMERDRISLTLADKEKKYADLVEMNEKINRQSIGMRRENRQLRNKMEEYQREERILREQIKYAKEKIQHLTNNSQKIDQEKYSYFKKQLEKSVITAKKLQKTCEKYSVERQQRKKQLEQKEKEITNLKANVQKLKEKKRKLQLQLQQQKQTRQKMVIEYDRKLSQCTTRQQQLVDIINYKNRQGDGIRESMKGQELILEEEAKIRFNIDTMTDHIDSTETGVMTDPVAFQAHQKHTYATKPIIPSQMILENEFLLDDSLDKQHKKSVEQPKLKQTPPQLNFFGDLVAENEDDHFDICEQGDQELIQKVSSNLQLKDTFNTLRQTIEKLFNEDDISVSTVKLLPKHLEDDFNDFISYIKEKIRQIKEENNLTFIMAQAGNQPSDVDSVLQQFLAKPSPQFMKMRKIIDEKDNLITSLMNQKTQQENTITEQQNMQEQIQRLHLQQYSVLKGQIHEQKQNIDKQLLYYQSLKNILKKMMNFWIQDEDNYDDFQDNLNLITTIYKFNPKQLELLKLYLKKYRQLKQIQ